MKEAAVRGARMLIVFSILCLGAFSGGAGEVLSTIPESPDVEKRYLFYLHGAILETGLERPTHPEFGTYEYPKLLRAFADAGFVVLGERRGKGANVDAHAAEVVSQVRALLAAGVPDEAITVVGFSKGGAIAIRVSSLLGNEKLGFVFLGSCGPWVFRPELRVSGRILSIFEASDALAGTCQPLFDNAAKVSAKKEIRIDTGRNHGAFYAPWKEWLEPTVEWAAGGS